MNYNTGTCFTMSGNHNDELICKEKTTKKDCNNANCEWISKEDNTLINEFTQNQKKGGEV